MFPTARTAVLPLLLAAGFTLGGLTACGSDDTATTGADASASTSTSASATAESQVSLRDPWVKAADNGMTAAFGTLVNDSDTDVTVTSASSSVAGMVELHEVVTSGGTSQMQPKEGGFVIPAGGTHELKPGGDHIMLMKLTSAIATGTEVTIVLTLDNGQTVTVTAVAKEYAGGNESYAPDGGASPAPSMSMSMSSPMG